MTTLTQELKAVLTGAGAVLVGVGNMEGAENCTYPVGVVVGIPVPRPILRDLQVNPTEEYHRMYHEVNALLNVIAETGADFLRGRGYSALAQSQNRSQESLAQNPPIPHKTLATRAGLGWIGKSCLLVTEEFGSALRISSLLTDAPLETAEPVNASRCGKCNKCVEACPAQALTGSLWSVGVSRDELVDGDACREKMKEVMLAATGIDQGLCGKCFAFCPWSIRYLEQE